VYATLGGLHWVLRRRFLQISLEPAAAAREGRWVRAWDFIFYLTFGVVVTSSVRIAGQPVSFTEAEKQAILAARPEAFKKIEVLQKETGRTAGWTCAVGLAQVVAAIAGDTGEIFPASVILEGEYGLTGLSMGVPVRLGRGGVREILEWDLATDEQAAVAACAAQLAAACRSVDEVLSA